MQLYVQMSSSRFAHLLPGAQDKKPMFSGSLETLVDKNNGVALYQQNTKEEQWKWNNETT